MIDIFENGGRWLLVKNLRWVASQEFTGASMGPGRGRQAFDACWCGSMWASQRHFAKKFDTREDASLYLAQNRDLLEKHAL